MSRKSKQENSRKTFILSSNSPFQVQEAYKSLRTNVQFSLPSNECKFIGITSSDRGEGKSTTAINLALSFAELGKKVVLVDCDLRMPTVAGKLNIPGDPGLSNFIIGEKSFNEICLKHKEYGLYVIPSGSIPPDATRLLQSEELRNLFQQCRKTADYVIIDLPPVTVVSDALLLSDIMDGYLIIVQSGRTSAKKISETMGALRLADAKVLGFVSTMNNRGNGSYYRYKRYGYGYGYGYGYYGKQKKQQDYDTKGDKEDHAAST